MYKSDIALYEVTDGLAIPAELQGLPLAIPGSLPQNIPTGPTGPYVARAHPMSPKWVQQQNAGCEEGDMYLCDGGTFYPLKPMGYFLVAISELYYSAIKPGDGAVTLAWPGNKDISEVKEYNKSKKKQDELAPHYVSLCLVQIGNKLIPAKVDFRDTLLNGVTGAMNATKSAFEPDWVLTSDAHRIAAGCPIAFGRMFHSAHTYKDTAKGSGNTMYPAVCMSKPATVEQINLLLRSWNTADFQFKLEQAKQSFHARVQALEEKLQ